MKKGYKRLLCFEFFVFLILVLNSFVWNILNEYTISWNMKKVKSTDFGTMFELTYLISLKDTDHQKEFLDKLRERNGNLSISLSLRRFNGEE